MNNEEKKLDTEVSKDSVKTARNTFLNPNPDILRYKTNKVSFNLIMIALVVNCLAFLDYYGRKNVKPDIWLGLDVIINILMLLAFFVTAEETKAYRKLFGGVSIGLAVIQIARIFFIPLKYSNALIEYGSFIYIVILYVLSALLLVGAGLVCLFRSNVLYSYLDSLKQAEVKETKEELKKED